MSLQAGRGTVPGEAAQARPAALHELGPQVGVAEQARQGARDVGGSVRIDVERAIAADLETPSQVIPNAYRDGLFHLMPEVPRTRDLVFLGRLV